MTSNMQKLLSWVIGILITIIIGLEGIVLGHLMKEFSEYLRDQGEMKSRIVSIEEKTVPSSIVNDSIRLVALLQQNQNRLLIQVEALEQRVRHTEIIVAKGERQ